MRKYSALSLPFSMSDITVIHTSVLTFKRYIYISLQSISTREALSKSLEKWIGLYGATDAATIAANVH